MTLKEIAAELVAGCREGRETDNLAKLYAENAVSVEPTDTGQGREAHGLDAIRGKHAWWDAEMEVSEGVISDPLLHGDDRFAVHFRVNGRTKKTGEVWNLEEIAVYHVSDGKIVREEFFYNM